MTAHESLTLQIFLRLAELRSLGLTPTRILVSQEAVEANKDNRSFQGEAFCGTPFRIGGKLPFEVRVKGGKKAEETARRLKAYKPPTYSIDLDSKPCWSPCGTEL